MEAQSSALADAGSASSGGTSANTNNASADASSSASNSNTEVQSGSETTTQEKVAAEIKKQKYKLKINGKDEEVEYDEPTLVKELQKARAASKVREEAAKEREAARAESEKITQERAQFQQLVQALRDPATARQILRQIGTPMEDLSKAELEDYIQQQQMTPEQRELQQLRTWKQQQEQQKQLMEQHQQQQEYDRQVQAHQEQFASRIVGAMTKLGLSETDARASGEIAQRLAFKLEQALNSGWDMTPDELAEELRDDMREQHRALYGKLSGDQLFSLFGEDGLKKAQQFATSRVTQVPSVDNPPKTGGVPPGSPPGTIPEFKGPNRRQQLEDYISSIQIPEEE